MCQHRSVMGHLLPVVCLVVRLGFLGIKRSRVLGVRVNDLCQGFRGLGLRLRVNGYGVEDSLRCGVCGSMFRGARV